MNTPIALIAVDRGVEVLNFRGARASADELSRARTRLADLIVACDRTVRAFEALGTSSGVIATLESRRECEAALVAQKAAIAAVKNHPKECPGCRETLDGKLECCQPDAAAFHQLGVDAE